MYKKSSTTLPYFKVQSLAPKLLEIKTQSCIIPFTSLRFFSIAIFVCLTVCAACLNNNSAAQILNRG